MMTRQPLAPPNRKSASGRLAASTASAAMSPCRWFRQRSGPPHSETGRVSYCDLRKYMTDSEQLRLAPEGTRVCSVAASTQMLSGSVPEVPEITPRNSWPSRPRTRTASEQDRHKDERQRDPPQRG